MELFLLVNQNYDYEDLCEEIEHLQREEDESIVDFE